MAEAVVKIEGMSCQHCVTAVKKALEALDGVKKADVQIGSAKVFYDETKLGIKDIEKAVVKAGYKVGGS